MSMAETGETLRWQIGDVRITRIHETAFDLPCDILFPTATLAEVQAMDWLKPHFINEDGSLTLSIQALIVEAPGITVVVDTCIGNDKARATMGNLLNTDFIARFEREGVRRDQVDAVLCTHLHVDHVGWNTMLVDGQWVPTFPAARYFFARTEFEYWRDNPAGPDDAALFADSIAPIVAAGLAELVEPDHRLSGELRLVPTPGHTPGHVSLAISSRGQHGFITGDMTHHPSQWTRPDWAAFVDTDPVRSVVTREAIREELLDQSALIIGTHYPSPTAGRAVRDEGQWRFLGQAQTVLPNR
jgi:glyoxylase-like metal-dependent hydrolase (beta-lactamase superfamily II)